MIDIDLLDAFYKDRERKLDEVAVYQALCSYHFAKEAEKQKVSEPNEQMVLEIFRIKEQTEPKSKAIEVDELNYIRKLLFWDNEFRFTTIMQDLMKQRKLIYVSNVGYQLAPQEEDKE